jgi:CP family cyanate transporter-like MFS transporter
MDTDQRDARDRRDRWRFFLIWLAGADLRLTILAVPPVLPLIHRDLGLDEKAIAALTGLPVLLFGLAAVPGSLLIARLGLYRALIGGLLLTALGSALRGLGPSLPMLFAMTFVMGAGVAILQPALPALVSQWFAARAPFATAVYANGLLIGEALPASLTIPLVLPLLGDRWPWSFLFWSAPVWATALLMRATPSAAPARPLQRLRWWPDWSDRRVWELGVIQGGGSAIYYASNAFLPDYLHAIGRPELVNACLTALNVGQLPASFMILASARRLAGRRAPLVAVGLVSLGCFAALLLQVPWLMVASAGVIGFAAAFVLILTLALPPLLRPPEDVHRLAAGMLAIGYSLTFIVPMIGGAIWDATGLAATAFLPGALGAIIVSVAALTLRPVPQT